MQFLPTSKEYNKPTEDPIIGRDGENKLALCVQDKMKIFQFDKRLNFKLFAANVSKKT